MNFVNAALHQVADSRNQNQSSGQGQNQGQGLSGANTLPGGFSASSLLSLLDNDDDVRKTADEASRRTDSPGDSDMFKSILGALNQKKDQVAGEDVDEKDAVENHQRVFGGNDNGDQADSKSLGNAAAIQAMKLFTSGSQGQSGSGQGAFLALALSEASKLFDQKTSQGQVAPGTSKESVVQQAGEMALKLFLKSKTQDQSGGGSGGAANLLSMASKYL